MASYYVWSGATGSANGSSWANAFTTLTTAFATEAAGDTLYVAQDHAESSATALALTSSGTVTNITKIICVNRAGSVPPVSADRRATAQVATTGNVNITLSGFAHYDGIIFIAGNSTGVATIIIQGSSGAATRLDNCSLRLGSTGAGVIQTGLSSQGGIYCELNNTTMSFSAVGQTVQMRGVLKWRNTTSALIGTAVPSFLFTPLTVTGGDFECIGVDLSAAGSGKTLIDNASTTFARNCRFVDCKLNASVTKQSATTAHGGLTADFIRSGASGVNYAVHVQRVGAVLTEETTIVRTGGAVAGPGETPISWKVVTTANCVYSMPFEAPPIAIWNDTTGSAKTATIECVWGGGAVPLDSEIWVDLEYLGDASSPQGSFINDGTPDLLTTPANQTSSSATWGGSTTKFKLEVTFTAQQKGWVYARVKCAKASSTFYLDPLVVLS